MTAIIFHVNNAGRTIHSPNPIESCNWDDVAQEDRGELGFTAAAMRLVNDGYKPCGHCLEAEFSGEDD